MVRLWYLAAGHAGKKPEYYSSYYYSYSEFKSPFNADLSNWDVSRVTNMQGMFDSTPSFNSDLSNWDVLHVTNMDRMFADASLFNGDISKWDVSKVTDMEGMFFRASSFAQTLCGAWFTSKAYQDQMFDGSSGRICTSTSRTTCMKTLTLTLDKSCSLL